MADAKQPVAGPIRVEYTSYEAAKEAFDKNLRIQSIYKNDDTGGYYAILFPEFRPKYKYNKKQIAQ